MEDPIQEAMATWQPHYEHHLTPIDGQEILDNWTAYMRVLSQWLEDKERRELETKEKASRPIA